MKIVRPKEDVAKLEESVAEGQKEKVTIPPFKKTAYTLCMPNWTPPSAVMCR